MPPMVSHGFQDPFALANPAGSLRQVRLELGVPAEVVGGLAHEGPKDQ